MTNLPTTPAEARTEQKRVLEQGKSVTQIRAEWEAIEAKRPGGNFDAALLPLKLNRARATEREQHLIDVIETPHNTVRGYHAEMGILLERDAEHEAALERARGLVKEIEDEAERDLDFGNWGASDSRDEIRYKIRKFRRAALVTAPAPQQP